MGEKPNAAYGCSVLTGAGIRALLHSVELHHLQVNILLFKLLLATAPSVLTFTERGRYSAESSSILLYTSTPK